MNEDQIIEWKVSWRNEYLKWLCGFANTQGGVLEVGRNDHGQVVGLKNANRLIEELPNKLRDLLGIVADVDLLTEHGQPYVRIAVKPYPVPISYKGEYHYRSGSTKQVLKGAALDHFLLGKTGRCWDAVPVPNVEVNDLDAVTLNGFRERAIRTQRLGADALTEDNVSLIDKLRLTEGRYLKRAAILLFHPDPEYFFTGAAIKIGYFEGTTGLRYHDEVCGNLFTQVSKTLDLLLTKYLKAAIHYEGLQRIESYPVPQEALREAVLNAVVHRDYAVAAQIQIRVYADRLHIWNPGELPKTWSLAKLLGPHPSRPFNPDVANAFFRAGEIESWGRGVQRIFEVCHETGVPEPTIQIEPGELQVEFPFSEVYLEGMMGSGQQINKNLRETTQETSKTTQETTQTTQETSKTTQETTQTTQETSKTTQEKILALLRDDPELTHKMLATRIGITPDGVRYHLDSLRKAGRIRHVGPTKKGHWEIVNNNDE